jgi:hypothetical protein
MKLRAAILAVLTVVLLAILSFHRPTSDLTQVRPADALAPSLPEITRPSPADSNLTLAVVRERALRPYRLRPDARFMLAIREVRRLTGVPDSIVTSQFTGGRWTVRCGSQEVGSLSELPEFEELLEVLTDWARHHAWQRGWSEAGGPQRRDLQWALDRLDAEGALREADRAWAKGARDAVLFRYAARAYGLWSLATPDRVGTTDPIGARGLACLALARALGAEEPMREACVLAEALGYAAWAREHARALPAQDPVRMYVRREDGELRAAAESATTLEAPLFHLMRLAQSGEYEEWARILESRFAKVPPSTLAFVQATGLWMRRFEAHLPVAHGVLDALTAMSQRRPVSRAAPPLGTRVAELERWLTARTTGPEAVMVDPELVTAHVRSLIYSALDQIGQHAMESRASVVDTRGFEIAIKPPVPQGPAAEFHRWYSNLADAKVGRMDVVALTRDFELQAFGAPLVLRSYEALRATMPLNDPNLRGAVHRLVRRLDSRPEQRAELALIVERDLCALNLAERLGRSAAAARGPSDPRLLAWCARFDGDMDELHHLLAMPRIDDGHRRSVLQLVASLEEAPDTLVQAVFERELQGESMPWAIVDAYATWLEDKKRYAGSRAVVERWRTQAREDSGWSFEHIFARTRIARMLQFEGRPEDALEVLGDLHRTHQFGAMQRTALVYQDLNRPHQAVALAWAAHRRYPHLPGGRILLAEIFWRQGRYAQAARILRDPLFPITGTDWALLIAPRYVEIFRNRPREAIQAAQALVLTGFRDGATIGAIAAKFAEERSYSLAFEIQSRVKTTGVARLQSIALAYGHLKHARGEAEAIRWVSGQVKGPDLSRFRLFVHEEGHHELLWALPTEDVPGPDRDYVLLLRAAACLVFGPSHPSHAETVREVSAARGSYYVEIARHLLGERDETAMLRMARSMKLKAEIYYFLGFKAQHEGRVRDAGDWYQMSVATGAITNAEPRWALRQLSRWAERGRRLENAPRPSNRGAA